MLATSAGFIMASSSTVATPLLSVGVATMNALVMLPPPSSAPPIPPSVVLVVASLSLSFHPHVSLDHLYTSSNADSLCGANYKLEQKTLVGFVSAFHKKLIQSVRVQNTTDSAKVFLQRSLAILEENGQRHQKALHKVSSLWIDQKEGYYLHSLEIGVP